MTSSNDTNLLVHDRNKGTLFTLQPGAALFGTALPHELDDAEKEATKSEASNGVRNEVVGRSGDTEEIVRGERVGTADVHPLLVAGDGSVLGAVDEFSQGDISMVAKDMDILEVGVGAVPELNAEEVADVRRRAAAELDGDGRGKIGNASEFGVLLGDSSLVEEGNEWLVGGLNQHELERVAIERNALERSKDRVKNCASSDISNTGNVSVGEDAMLVVVSPVACLFKEGGWKAVREGLVVSEF